jgi:hypothetical protein
VECKAQAISGGFAALEAIERDAAKIVDGSRVAA